MPAPSVPRLTALGVAATLALTACGNDFGEEEQSRDSDSTANDTLRIAWGLEILTMDPPDEAGILGLSVIHNVYETLVGYDFDASEVVPSLAESWEISDDGLTYTFQLDPDATFADGSPVTSEDVAWSFQRVVDWPEAIQGFQIRPALEPATIETPDEDTVEITLAAPSGSFLSSLTGTAASIINQDAVVEAAGDDVATQRQWLSENTAGSGKYVLNEWERASYATLGRNDEYWRDEPRYETVQIEFITESAQQVSGLQQGDVDVALGVLPAQLDELEQDGFEVASFADLSTYYLGLNLANEPFDDPRVRDAIRYAIDYEGIIDGLLGGRAVKAGGILGEGLVGYDESLNDLYTHDPERARELLAEAGLADGFSFPLSLANDTVKGLGVPTDTLATKIQSDLAEVGITVDLNVQDINALFPLYREGDVQAILWYFGPSYPDPDPIASPHGDHDTQATTRVSYDDPEVTEQIQEARRLVDVEARQELYVQIGQEVSTEGPYVFLFRPLASAAIAEDVEGIRLVPIWTFELD